MPCERKTIDVFEELQALSGESTVMVELLAEDADLVRMLKEGRTREECLNYVNTNY